MYDSIVIGAGHNGLTCAAYLARGGKNVLVLEARDTVGGLCWTMDMPNAPGYRVNPCGLEFLLTGVEPSVDHELELHRYGLSWEHPQTLTTWLGPDGQHLTVWKDRQKMLEEIRKYSRRDAVKYEQLVDEITDTLMVALPYLQGHPFRVRPSVLRDVLKNLAKGRKNVARGARVMLSSIETICLEYFEREEVQIPIATYSLANFGPMHEPGSGLHLSLLCGLHEWGVRHPVGGSGSFTQALAACVRAHGGTVRTSAPVREILIENGRARGVVLASGEEIRARDVVGAVDPTTLMTKLVEQSHVPPQTKEEIRGLQSLRNNLYTFKIDAALSKRPEYPNHDLANPHAVAAPMVCPSMDFLRRSTTKAMAGDFDHEIALQMAVPSIDDRTLVPDGSTGDSFYLYAFNTPVQLSDDRDWAVEGKRYIDACLDQFEQYSPGFKDSIIDLHVTNPDDFASRYHVHKGNYEHADVTLAQLGPWRPVPSMAGYKTPVDNLWHSASGAFPMSFISGWPGRNTANMLLRGPSPLQRARKLARRG
jgi:beta-carotene ketolase (CrtO type)